MPGCCSAPNCNSNYAGGPTVRVCRFPANAAERAAWTRAVPRKDFAPTKYTVLCEKHFHPSDFVTSTSYTDSATGRVVEVPLKLRRLKPGITPSIFPGCPTYLSQDKSADREAPEEKRARLDAKALQEVVQHSLITQREEEKNNSISCLEDLLYHTDKFLVGEFWSKVVLKDKVHFLNLAPQDAPVVHCAGVVNADLSLKVYFRETRIEKAGTVMFPVSISDVRQLGDTLDRLEEIVKGSQNDEGKVELLLRRISALLEELSASQFPSDWQAELLKFLRKQVEIVLSNAIRYPAELLVFASIMFTILCSQ